MTALHAHEIPFASSTRVPDGWRLLDDVELMDLPDPEFLIDGILTRRGLTIVYGPPGSCKTTLDASIGVALATGRPWHGHAVRRQGSSVYVGAEDVSGWKLRLKAAKRAAGLPLDHPIGAYTFPEVIDLRELSQVGRFVQFVKDADVRPLRVTFDTFAASTPGASENNSEDMTAAIAGAQKVMTALDCSVTIIHHSNAGGTRERGHSAMRGSADTMICVTPADDVIDVECSKQRNGPPFDKLVLKLVPLPEGGCVLRLATDVLPSKALTPMQSKVLDVLKDIGGRDGITKTTWRGACPDMVERTFYKVVNVLLTKGHVMQSGSNYRLGAGQ